MSNHVGGLTTSTRQSDEQTQGLKSRKNPRLGLRMLPLVFMLTSHADAPGQAIRLEVSAVVSPTPCRYPESCRLDGPAFGSKVIIESGEIYYLGTPPEVTQEGDRLIVLF